PIIEGFPMGCKNHLRLPFQPAWGHRAYLTRVTLNRLSHPDVEQIVDRITDGKSLPSEVLRQIVEKTDAVPLYVEECTKAILESGLLKEIDGRYEQIGTSVSLTIPSSLQDSLMSRLDRLVSAKGVAQLGATIARQFSYELLQAVSRLDDVTLQRELERLVNAELVYQKGEPTQAIYIFKHALIRDAAYESLLRSTRQGYHRRIAEVLEAQFPETVETQPELLAYHCTESGLHEAAVPYWYQAGQRASERSANLEAICHFNRGLELMSTLAHTPDHAQQELTLCLSLGKVLEAVKGQAAAEVQDVYTRARELCERMEAAPQLFLTLTGLCGSYIARAELQTAWQLGEQLLTLAQRNHDSIYLFCAHQMLGTISLHQGQLASARQHYEQALNLYKCQPPSTVAELGIDSGVMCLAHLSTTLWFLGYSAQAQTRSREALELAQDLAHPFSLAYALCWTSHRHVYWGEIHAAQERAEAVMALATEHHYAALIAWGMLSLGWTVASQGNYQEGIDQIRQGLTMYWGTEAKLYKLYGVSILVEAYGMAGQIEEGLALLSSILEIDITEDRCWEPEAYRLKGELLLQLAVPDVTQAETCFQQALSKAREQQAKSFELRAAMSLARVWQQQEQHQDAYNLLAPVYNWFTEGFETADLIDAKMLLDELRA
ncbi:ATP-binding protein, partial [Candidatus Entotheonella palauensis]|uniref:ATP-binding protein n=1 Tax=Candidatus Entotheonella palauensis TaxID=93172 RepID=UPI003FA459FF